MIAPREQTSCCAEDRDCGRTGIHLTTPQSRRLEEAINHETADISGHIAHALRNPLWTLQLALNSGPGAPLEENIDLMKTSMLRMETIIRAVESLSTLSSRRMRCRPVDLSELASETFEAIRETERERNVTFRAGDSAVVMADSDMLKILFHQILQNAWSSTRENPNAEIIFGVQAPGDLEQEHSTHLVCFLTDNGVGFPDEAAREAFAPFRSLRVAGGVQAEGMGLALAKRIVHRHGGQIWAANEPVGGATVTFSLPRAAAVPKSDTPRNDPRSQDPLAHASGQRITAG